MPVQNLISFDDSSRALNISELEKQQNIPIQQANSCLNRQTILSDNEVSDNLDLNLNGNFRLYENNDSGLSNSIKANGLLQLNESHFNNVLVERNALPDVDQVRPHPLKRHVGVFWDIQNCSISQPNHVANVVQNIRELYADLDAIEGEFAVVCDVFGVNRQVLSALNNLQANVLHVCSYSKNACDEKLKQLIYRFVALYDKSSIIVLISSDINFAPICSDLKYRQQVYVILIHSYQVSSSLVVAANECRSFETFRSGDKLDIDGKNFHLSNAVEIIVTISNWPSSYTLSDAETLLTCVSKNVGGKVVWVNSRKRFGIVLFKSLTDAQRCAQHVNNRTIRGSKLIAKILHSDDAQSTDETSNFENDLIKIIEKNPLLEVNISDLHQELLKTYPQRYHFAYKEFLTFLNAYESKKIIIEKDCLKLNKFYHIAAIGLRMLSIFHFRHNPIKIEDVFESYVQSYRLAINDSCPDDIWKLFKNIFWIFARLSIVKNIVLLRMSGIGKLAKFDDYHWSCETTKIISILRCKTMNFQEFYEKYCNRFETYLASSIFWYERFNNVFTIQKNNHEQYLISPTLLYQFVDRCLVIILRHFPQSNCTFEELNNKYWTHFGVEPPAPLDFGFTDLGNLFKNIIIFKVHGDVITFEHSNMFDVDEFCNYCALSDEEDETQTFDDPFVDDYCFDDDDDDDGEEESGEISDNEESDNDSIGDIVL